MKLLQNALKTSLLALSFAALGAVTASASQDDNGWIWWPESTDNFSYTFVQGGYGYQSATNNRSWDAVEGRASIGLGRSFYVSGTFAQLEDQDFDGFEQQGYSAAFGVHGSISDEVDILFDVGYTSLTLDTPTISVDADGPQVGLGFRGMSPGRHFEAEARYAHRWTEDDLGTSDDNGEFTFDLVWRATDHFGLVARGAWETEASETIGTYTGGLRFWF